MSRPIIDEDERFIIVSPTLFHTTLERFLVLPVIEDEEGNGVWGFGHWDKKLFAWMVNTYDRHLTGGSEWETYKKKSVEHIYAYGYKHVDRIHEDYFNWHRVDGEPDLEDPFLFKMTKVSR